MQLVVVGGGTGTNAVAPVFEKVAYKITYVVPISDNGGSTSEVLRIFGGPAIGDARSRLVRLIDPSPLRNMLALRLSDNAELAAHDWTQIVDGSHSIWTEIPLYMKAMYRAFLVHVHAELLKRTTTTKPFDYSRASVGNLLLTGARLFFGTLDAAIEFVLNTTRVSQRYAILPCLNSNSSHHIAAKLRNGTTVVGQSAISHPSTDFSELASSSVSTNTEEDLNFSFVHPSLAQSQITFEKSGTHPLPSAIERVYYVNLYGDEVRPSASQRVISNLQTADAVVCSVGSLYTSIIPILLLQGFSANLPRHLVVMLNGSDDRETEGMRPIEHVNAINHALEYSRTGEFRSGGMYVTSIIYPTNLNMDEITRYKNIHVEPAECVDGEYRLDSLTEALNRCLHNTGPAIVSIDEI